MRKREIILICLLLLLVYVIFSRRVEGFGEDGFFERLFTWMTGSSDDSECGNWSYLKIDNKTSNMYIHPKIQFKPHIIKIWNNLHEDCKITKQSLTQIGIDLEQKLSNLQVSKIKNIIKKSEEKDINGFKRILYDMIDEEGKRKFNELNK